MSTRRFQTKISRDTSLQLKEYLHDFLYSEDFEQDFNCFVQKIWVESELAWSKHLVDIVKEDKAVKEKIKDKLLGLDPYSSLYLVNMIIILFDEIGYECLGNYDSEKTPENIKHFLFSFLISKNLGLARSLDLKYVKDNFGDFLTVSSDPIGPLVEQSLESNQFIEVVIPLVNSNRYLRFEVIQYIISQINRHEYKKGIEFLTLLLESGNDEGIRLASDILESIQAQHAFKDYHSHRSSEIIFNSGVAAYDCAKDLTIRSLVRSLNNIKDTFGFMQPAFVMRKGLQDLSAVDKHKLYDIVEGFSKLRVSEVNFKVKRVPKHFLDSPELSANYLQKHFVKRDVIGLAMELGIRVTIQPFETTNFEGCLVREATLSTPIIVINSKKSLGRKNFTIAHEIAHAILLGHDSDEYICTSEHLEQFNNFKTSSKVEDEANTFASELLLPKKEFIPKIRNTDFNFKNLSLLAEEYGTSLTFTAQKWVKLSNHAIGFIITDKNNVEACWTSEEFETTVAQSNVSRQTISEDLLVEALENPGVVKKIKSEVGTWFISSNSDYQIVSESRCIYENKVLTLFQAIED